MAKNKKLPAPINRYLKEIAYFLPHREKKRLLADLKQEIIAFWEDNPDADANALIKRFGSPQEVAGAFLLQESILPGKAEKNAKIVLVVLLTVAVILICLVYAMIRQNNEHAPVREGENISDGTTVT